MFFVPIAGWYRLKRAGLCALLLCLPLTAWAKEPIGTLGIVGSDTMAGLMLRWGEQLSGHYSGIRLQLQTGGSASAATALAAGTTRLGPMSRSMNEAERQEFEAQHGYAAVELEVARDALAVVVHRHHPLESLTLEALDAIYSTTRRCGGTTDIRRWEQLGIEGMGGRIELHGRNPASGSHGLFRQRALCGGDYRPQLNEYPGAAAVTAAVTESREAIGYVGLNHLTPGVKPLALGASEDNLIAPEAEQIRQGTYPLSRSLLLYVNLPPGAALEGPERALLELILSPEGQRTVAALGFVTLSAETVTAQRQRLGFDGAAL